MKTKTSDAQPEPRESGPKHLRAEALRVAGGIRRRVLEHCIQSNGGYLSQACSSAEILAALYLCVMRLGPSVAPPVPTPFAGPPRPGVHPATGAGYNGEQSPALDRFFLSPSQYALVLYAALVELGRLSPDALLQFNRDGSTVEMIGAEHSPGMEVMSGSLGQGLSQAAGVALARKRKGETGRVWVFLSDGELQAGQTWECFQALSFHGIDNIGIYVDVNGQQCDGAMSDVMNIEPIEDRLEAFGARVRRVDGHDVKELVLASKHLGKKKPLVVLCDTDPCRGVDLLEANAPKLHYLRFKSADEKARYQEALSRME